LGERAARAIVVAAACPTLERAPTDRGAPSP
jgi:hypothetical protein